MHINKQMDKYNDKYRTKDDLSDWKRFNIVCNAESKRGIGHRMIMTKHKEASAEALGTRICLNFDSPSSQTAPMVMHQPRYSISKLE